MIPSAKLKDILKIHAQDLGDYNLAPVIADAYLQGGKECVSELKELLDNAGIERKLFGDAIEKIITDLLRASLS